MPQDLLAFLKLGTRPALGSYRSTSCIRKSPPPQRPPHGPRRMLLKVPKGRLFLMSEVPLCARGVGDFTWARYP